MLIAMLFALMGMTLDGPSPAAADAAAPADAAPQTAAPQTTPSLVLPTSLPILRPSPSEQSTNSRKGRGLRFVWRDHPSIRAGRNFRLDFAAKFQFDSRDPGDDPVDFETYEVHRMRVGIEGELFRHIEYSVERELSERELRDPIQQSTKTFWKDVFVEANYTRKAQIRVGKFKVPFGLDQTSSVSDLDFIYRSLGGNYLSPGRDVGVMVHGRFFDRALRYRVGWFEQDGDNSRSRKIAGGDETIAARVTASPFKKVKGLEEAEVGVSFATTSVSDESVLPNGLRGRTVLSQYTFFEPMFVKGDRRRMGVDLDWTAGPFGARAEYSRVADAREDQGIGNEDLNDVRGQSWYVLGTCVLTGEKKTRPVKPKKGFLQGGFGAVEIGARFDRLWFDGKPGLDPPFRNSRAETVFPSGDKVVTLAVTWYANLWVKVQFNAIREEIEDTERSPIPGRASFWSPVLRFQLQL